MEHVGLGKTYEEKVPEGVLKEESSRYLMEGLKKLNVSIKLLSGSVSDLFTKSKYKGLFDIVVLSLKSDGVLTDEAINVLLNENATIYCECGDNLVVLKDQQ
jgi:hypothetical protein